MKIPHVAKRHLGERGATLVFVGLSLLALLGIMALAIDLGMLYVARSEAQRSADAAALAGANVFSTSGCATVNTCETSSVETDAAQAAFATASQNPVAGAAPTIDCGSDYTGNTCPKNQTPGIVFTDPTSKGTEPQITVSLHRSGIETIFAKMFGVFSGTVSASATAEAYLGTASNYCPVPFLVPNCDPNPANTAGNNYNDSCYPKGTYAPFISGTGSSQTVANPEVYTGSPTTYDATSPGVYGEPWRLHYTYNSTPGPAGSVVPSQWSMASFPSANGTLSNGTSQLVQEIQQCPAVPIVCGDQVGVNPGNSPVPINKAINERIYYGKANSPSGPGNGQDTLNTDPTATSAAGCTAPAFPFNYGSWWEKVTQPTNVPGTSCGVPSDSHSLVWAPVYDGNQLSPGCSGKNGLGCKVTVMGFVQLFLVDSQINASHEYVDTYVLNVEPCNTSANVTTPGATIPIRLIQKAN